MCSPAARFEFRIGGEIASVAGGEVCAGSSGEPDAVVTGDAPGLYRLLVERDLGAVGIEGRVDAVEAMLASLPATASAAAEVSA
jgi:hypothetical protein